MNEYEYLSQSLNKQESTEAKNGLNEREELVSVSNAIHYVIMDSLRLQSEIMGNTKGRLVHVQLSPHHIIQSSDKKNNLMEESAVKEARNGRMFYNLCFMTERNSCTFEIFPVIYIEDDGLGFKNVQRME